MRLSEAEISCRSTKQGFAMPASARVNNVHDLTQRIELELIRPHADLSKDEKSSIAAGKYLLFVLIVICPTLVTTIYYYFIAADQYASEARFIVRSPNHAATGLLSGFLQSTGFARSHDDSYAVSDFIKSRSAASQLAQTHQLREILGRPEADFMTRYPRPWETDSSEGLYRRYLNFVKVDIDTSSGITTLEVRAFKAEDAHALAVALLEDAEALINRLNDRAHSDAIHYARLEVSDAGTRLADVEHQITEFRNREAMVDPQKQSTSELDLVQKLESQAAAQTTQLREVKRQAPDSPQIAALNARIVATELEIAKVRATIVGSDSSMAPRIEQYEHLLLERDLAARMFDAASTSLENASIEAQRKQLYLERVVEPNVPDRALYPKSLYSVLLALLLSVAVYCCIHFLKAHVWEEA
jgi:capsular polysaccharide transport system permease protein